MKIATWNVNSLRVRLEQVVRWLQQTRPDVLCLQETKLPDPDFPADAISAAGYRAVFSGQKTYNGVATISNAAWDDVVTELPGLMDPQRRVLATTIGATRILNVYIPNGQSVGSEKFSYKLEWLQKLIEYVESELDSHERLVLLGDFNIAPADEDVHDPAQWEGQVLCSDPERAMFQRLIDLGLRDVFRKFDQEPKSFSWWDYRAGAFRRNRGLRIDHILCAKSMYDRCSDCHIDTAPRGLERPSDHTPVVAEFATAVGTL